MSVDPSTAAPVRDRRKIDKALTERRIIAALPPGWHLIRINWKKSVKVHIADQHGRKKVLFLTA